MKGPTLILVLSVGLLVSLASDGWSQAATTPDGDSKQVAAVIEQLRKANDDRDLNLVLAQYSDDAMIDSKAARAKVSKAAFKEALVRLWQQDPKVWAEYGGIQVSVVGPAHAVAQGTVYIHLSNGTNIISRHEWKLEKREGRWLIVETNYR